MLDADWRAFTTLADAHQFLFGMMPDDRLREFVRDARSGNDITRSVLMQIIAEHEEHGQPIFTTELLTQVIRFRGDSMQGFLGSFLERSLQFFLEQQQQIRGQIGNLVGQAPWALLNQLAERNLDLWRSFQQGLGSGGGSTGTSARKSPRTPKSRAR